MPDAAITPRQLRAIHAGYRHLDMDDAERLVYLQSYQVLPCVDKECAGTPATSTKQLSRRQARNLITRLQQRGFPIGRPYSGSPIDRGSMAHVLPTPAQRAVIHRLREEISWKYEDGFDRWLKAKMHVNLVKSASDAERVIEGLKGLKQHGHAAD